MMKRTFKTITAIVMVLTLCFCLLTGCSSGITGKWKLDSASASGIEIDISELGGDMSIDLKSDGTCIFYMDGSQSNTGNWTNENGKITIDGADGQLKDGKLICTINGVEMVFVR